MAETQTLERREQSKADQDVITTARNRFDDCIEIRGDWERKALKDLKFKAGTDGERSYQWDQQVQSQRNSENRPCFTINRIPSFLKQVVNEWRQSSPTSSVAPVADGDDEVAETLQGLIRHVITNDDGEIAIDTAFENAVSAGLGWVIVVPRYLDDESDDQELYLDWVPDVFTCYHDFAAVKPDRSDMRFFFRVSTLPLAEYEAQWGAVSEAALLSIPAVQRARWFPSGQVVIADYYEVVEEKRKDKSRRPGKKHVVWRTINGLEVLAETTLPISRIPAVPCFGDQVFLEGKEDYRGMIRDGLDAQQAFNYWFTATTEQIALGTKGAYRLDPRQIEGFEDIWKTANKTNYPYLPAYRYVTLEDGSTVDMGMPERDVAEPPIQAMTVALNYADQALKQVMNLYEPSLGQRKSEQSGRAILALQQQGQIGNANYIDNGKRFLRSLARLLLQMFPVYYDAARVMRIIGKDEKPKTVMVHAGEDNAPDVIPDGVKKVYDISTGRYDVTVTTGPSFVNKRQEQLERVIDFLKVDPPAAQLSGDIVAGLMELPVLEERLKKALPPQFQDDGSPEATMAKMQGQMRLLMQQHDLLVKELQAKTQAIEQDQAKYQSQAQIKQAEFAFQLELQKLKNAATIAVAEINAQTKGVVSAQEATHEAIALMQSQAHEAHENALDRQHEAGMAAAGASQDEAMAGADREHEATENAADRSHEADQATAEQANAAALQREALDAQAQQAQNAPEAGA